MPPAYATWKNSHPAVYKTRRSSKFPSVRRSRLRSLAILGTLAAIFLFAASKLFWGKGEKLPRKPLGSPPVVIVTVLDPSSLSKNYLESIRENRIKYAERHDYRTFFAKPSDYDVQGAPSTWSRIAAMRHALTRFPECGYMWYLDQDSIIMNTQLSLEGHLLNPTRLESLMIKDFPVVPPDSIIRTFSHSRNQDVELIISQDEESLVSGSIVIRNSEWAKFFLDTWIDPLYRSYNFQKAESHALEHIVQWHPTVLSKLALVPQRIINSYGNDAPGENYQEGDLVVRFPDCAQPGGIGVRCETLAESFVKRWHADFGN